MPALALAPPPLGGAATERLMTVDIRPAPDVVVRVLVLLQRRRCTITSVDFRAADRHRPGRLLIGFEAPNGHADRVAHWVGALVDVLEVEFVEA
jgi:hypothetical protein